MTVLILMKILESAPSRYDLGIRLLTLGKLDAVYDRLMEPVQAGMQVLDIGCGTGALSLRAASRGACVKGIDTNPAMLEIVRQRAAEAGLEKKLNFVEMGASEMDGESSGHYDAVAAGLCFSELNPDELRFTLEQTWRILKPGGFLLAADEMRPPTLGLRLLHAALRLPLAALTWLLTQTATHAVRDLPQQVKAAGLQVETIQYNRLHSFICLIARKPQLEST